MVEIYNEQVWDLLAGKSKGGLTIVQDRAGGFKGKEV